MRALTRLSIGLASFLALAAPAAAQTNTNVQGTTWDLTCGGPCGTQSHTFETQDAAGNLTGRGRTPGGGVTWTITGRVTGSQITFTLNYSDGSYSATMTGTIAAGVQRITGTFDDSFGRNDVPFQMNRLSGGGGADPDEKPPVTGPPDPVAGRTVNAAAVEPGVLVKPPGTQSFSPLSEPSQLQVGTIVDARTGKVRITIADGRGGFDTADFYDGIFRIDQLATGSRFATLTLVGDSFKGCPRAPRAQLSAKRRPGRTVRQLWGSGTGRFRTVGRFSSASLRGTTWLTRDTCNGTLTRVTRGSVTVRDFVRRRAVVVRARRSYFAAARR